jgi:hypothetical protein
MLIASKTDSRHNKELNNKLNWVTEPAISDTESKLESRK